MPFKSISDSVVECKCPLLPLPIHSTQQPCIFGALWKEEVEGQSGIGKEVSDRGVLTGSDRAFRRSRGSEGEVTMIM